MKKLIILIFLFGGIHSLIAQTNDWAFGFDDVEVYSVSADGSGNVYYAGTFAGTVDFDPGTGTSNLTASANDIFISKFSVAGELTWVKQIEAQTSTPASTFFDLILVARARGVYLVANTKRPYDLDPGAGTVITTNTTAAIHLISLDSNGDLDFTKEIVGDEDIFSYDAVGKSNGDIVIVGTFAGTADFDPGASTHNVTSGGFNDPMVITLDDAGDFVSVFTFSGADSDAFTSISLDSDDDIWVTGFQRDDFTVNGKTFAASAFSNFFLELDPVTGTATSSKNWTSNSFDPRIAVDPISQDVYIGSDFTVTTDFDPGSGTTSFTPNGKDVVLSKFDQSGSFQWAIQEGAAGTDGFYDLEVDEQNRVHFAWSKNNDSFASASDMNYNVYDSEGSLVREEVPTQGYIREIDIVGFSMYWAGAFQNPTNNFDLCGGSLTLTHLANTAEEMFIATYTLEELADDPSISASSTAVYAGETVTLSIGSGDLNDANDWQWYSGNCDGTSIGSGTSVMVSPSVETTYFVRGEGYSCAVEGNCESITISITPPEITYGSTFDLTNGATLDGSYSSGLTNPSDFVFSSDGMRLFVLASQVRQFDLSVAYDVTSTLTFQGDYQPSLFQNKGMLFNTDGSKLYLLSSQDQAVFQHNLSVPYDITSTITSDGSSLSVSEDTDLTGMAFSSDGTKIFVVGRAGNQIDQYNLNSAFDITAGASHAGSFNIGNEDVSAQGVSFNADGTRMFMVGNQNKNINQYSLTNSFDITSGVTFENVVFSVSDEETLPNGLNFNSGGTKVYAIGTETDEVFQYSILDGGFIEKAADDGTVSGSIFMTVAGETFTSTGSTFSEGVDYSMPNLPDGFTSSIAVSTDGLSARLTLSGSANQHQDSDDLADLTFTFSNSAFAGNDASNVVNAVAASSGFGIDFFQGPITWDGTSWSNSTGPGAGSDDVIINGDYSVGTDGYFDSRDLTVNNGFTMTVDGENSLIMQRNLINNGSIVVESGSSLVTYSPNTITGNDITFKRNTRYADGRYSFVGSPVQQDASIVGSDLGTSVYKYNEATAYGADGINRWEAASSDELVPGKGYTQAGQQEIVFTGIPNQGTVTIDGSYTEDTNDDYEGWVLVSNPYPAAIDVADFLSGNTNTNGAIYIWDDNGSNTQRGTNADYIVANGTMATNTTSAGGQTRYDQTMGSMQGFFVKLNSAADVEIEFREDMRVTSGNTDDHFFRKTTLPLVRINLTNDDGLFKQTVIGLAEDATNNELNRTYDAEAFSSTSDNGLFTIKAGRTLSLNGMTQNWEVAQLQLNVSEEGIYQISAQLEDYNQSLYLKDNATGYITDLRSDVYSFNSQAGIDTDRFELISSPAEVLALEEKKVLVYAFNSVLHIQQEVSEAREYQIFNMKGQMMLSRRVESHEEEIDLSSYSKGIYLVFDGERTHKIILD